MTVSMVTEIGGASSFVDLDSESEMKMLGRLLQGVNDLSVIWRALYFVKNIPRTLPEFANRLYQFATNGNQEGLEKDMTSEQLTAMTGNLLSFYGVKNEETLWTELHGSSLKEGKYGLGVVLISEKESCRLCGKVLAAKFAKAVNVVVYHEGRGTFMGCRVPKVCCNKSCKLIQHYGYYTFQDNKFYDDDWEKQEYFLSTGKTAFHMNLLLKFEVEILIGKLSFKEKADIYNEVHGCVCDHDDNSKEHGKKKGKERR